MSEFVSEVAVPSFSFCYGGKKSAEFLSSWRREETWSGEDPEKRLRRSLSWRELIRVPAPWRLCEHEVCFEFGAADGPRVLRGEVQYSIIPERLKSGAVEVATDGRHAEVRSPCLPERPSSSAPWSLSTTRPSPRPDA